MNTKYIYQSSNVNNFKSNVTFQTLYDMDEKQFDEWCDLLRSEVLEQWDTYNIPPTANFKDTETIKANWRKLKGFDTNTFFIEDPEEGSLGIIRNYNKFASGINQFFPTMGKTKITKGSENPDNSYSIYDYFAMDELRDTFKKLMYQKVKRDVLYHFSKCIMPVDDVEGLFKSYQNNEEQGIMIMSQKSDKPDSEYMTLKASEIKDLYEKGLIDKVMMVNDEVSPDTVEDTYTLKNEDVRYNIYLVKVFDRKPKMFPEMFQVFKMSLGQPAVNFPPLTAKYLYDRFTSHIDGKVTIYDPSSGWGGRILGAMSAKKEVHYVGTDPNMDNYIDELGMSRYEYVAEFYNTEVSNSIFNDESTYELFQDGSELIGDNPKFQKYKGQLDFVFTSPPYFNREQYSQQETQSFKSHPTYEDWRDNFLKPTLKTAYEYLKNDRYLAWNIANIKVGLDKYIPLEEDSIAIMKELGAEYKGKLKMAMSRMIGIDNETESLNAVDIDGTMVKYEPIFIFYKGL